MRLRIFIVVVLMVVGVGAVAVTVMPSGGTAAGDAKYLTATAARANVVNQVVATGTVQPVAVYSLTFGSAPSVSSTSSSSSSSSNSSSNASSSGSTTWTVLTTTATPGKKVAKGDILATADAADAQLALTVAKAGLAAAQAKLSTDKAGLSPNDKAAAALSITQAQQSLSQASSSQSQTIAQNNLKVRQQRQAVSDAAKKISADRKAGAPSAQIAQDTAAWNSARNALATLLLQVAASNTQAANQVRSAQLGLTSARYGYKSKTAPATSATVASDQAGVATAQQSVTTAQAKVDGATLVSPVDGVVLTVNISPGVVAPSGAAITMQTSAMKVSGQVSESDLPSVQLGQAADITVTALKLTASGTVSQIDPTGSAGTSGGVVSYSIVVALPQPPAGTASGMSAQVSVTTASATNVIAVPAIALVRSNGQYAVRVLDGAGQPQLVPVTVGLVTTSSAEIQSGITAGTAVVVGTSSTRTGTTTNPTTTGVGIGGFGPGLGGGGGNFRGNGGN